MPDLSSDTAGMANYVVKRDWRRDLDQEVRSEGYVWFEPNPASGTPHDFPGTNEPITLIVMARSPLGQTAVIVGTQSSIYRYYGLENGNYVEDDYVIAGYLSDPGQWVKIGGGFSDLGRRWEWVNIADYLVLNNGVDLPVTYHMQDMEVETIWELREQGIACVGTIGESHGVLICGSIKTIEANRHLELMSLVKPTVSMIAAGDRYDVNGLKTVVVTTGRTYHYKPLNSDSSLTNGTEVFTDETDFVAAGASVTLTGGKGALITAVLNTRIVALQVGISQVPSLGKVNNGTDGLAGNTLTAQSNFFEDSHVGKKIRMGNGLERTIVARLPPNPQSSQVTLDGAPEVAEPDMPFYIPLSGGFDFRVIAGHPVFAPTDVGRMIIWDDGNVRTIKTYLTNQQVEVDSDGPVPSGPFGFENPEAYTAFDSAADLEHFQFRVLWSMPDKPRRFAATAPGAMVASTSILTLNYPVRSFEIGQEVLVVGAGGSGGNLTAKIVFIDQSRMRIVLDEVASTTTSNALVQASDSVGSIVAFEDLEDDGSEVLRIGNLRGTPVIYKATAIYLGKYLGVPGQAFVFEKVYPGKRETDTSKALCFRHTLVDVGGHYHIYAGRTDFYRFDLVTRTPTELQEFSECKGLFFRDAPGDWQLGHNRIPADATFDTVLEGSDPFNSFTLEDLPKGTYEIHQIGADGSQFFHPGGDYVLLGTPDAPVDYVLRRVELGDNLVFSANNTITKEIFIWFPGSGEDQAIRFDYRHGTVSTTSILATAAGTARRPGNPAEVGPIEDWFVMGHSDGKITRYGRATGADVMSGLVTATKAKDSNIVVASGNIFQPEHVGRSIFFDKGLVVAIKKFLSAKEVEVIGSGRVWQAEKFRVVNAVWHRNGVDYDSVLKSGLESYGNAHVEKQLNEYVLLLSSQSVSAPVVVEIWGAINAAKPVLIGTRTLSDPLVHSLIPIIARKHYFGDQLKVSGINNPIRLAGRLMSVAGIDTRSWSRK